MVIKFLLRVRCKKQKGKRRQDITCEGNHSYNPAVITYFLISTCSAMIKIDPQYMYKCDVNIALSLSSSIYSVKSNDAARDILQVIRIACCA
jgi:hypothetical protein